MILPINFEIIPFSYAFAAALYLDAYVTNSSILTLPKRTRKEVLNVRRIPHMSEWSESMHTQYRKLPVTMDLEQFVVLDDGWAESTFTLLRDQFRDNLHAAARVAFYMWKSILFWGSYGSKWYAAGFVATYDFIAQACGCSKAFAMKVVLAMIDAGLIHRKWTGYAGHGSCYLPGKANRVEELLASKGNEDE